MSTQRAQRRYQVIATNVPNATTAGVLREFSATLDQDFNKIVGIAFHEIEAGNNANNYNVGCRSARRVWVDLVNIKSWNADQNVAPDTKFRSVDIPYGKGDVFYAQVSPGANTNTDVLGQLVLVLERSLTQDPQ
jgi:hypothetical protein